MLVTQYTESSSHHRGPSNLPILTDQATGAAENPFGKSQKNATVADKSIAAAMNSLMNILIRLDPWSIMQQIVQDGEHFLSKGQ